MFKVSQVLNLIVSLKVKTTNIKNYMVRPNAEVIPSEHTLTVKIVTQNPINKVSKNILTNVLLQQTLALISDRFLV